MQPTFVINNHKVIDDEKYYINDYTEIQNTNFYFEFYLQSTCLNDPSMNFVQFLQEIAAEQQFEVTFVDIEEKTYSGQFQCLVQLSTLPVAVCQGAGKTSKIAQTSAARTALEYLKIMTKV